MRPTIGIRVFGFIMIGLMFQVMSGPDGEIYRQDLSTNLLIGSCVIFFVGFLLFYEVRYDIESVTAPGWFFRRQKHDWANFISIKQSDDVTYTLCFETGKLKVRKFLVGMPAFLTFVTEVSEINKRP